MNTKHVTIQLVHNNIPECFDEVLVILSNHGIDTQQIVESWEEAVQISDEYLNGPFVTEENSELPF